MGKTTRRAEKAPYDNSLVRFVQGRHPVEKHHIFIVEFLAQNADDLRTLLNRRFHTKLQGEPLED